MALTKILPGALGAGAVDSTAAVATGAIQADDLQAGTVTANKFGAGAVVSGVINTACVIDLNDNIKTRWGTSQDLEIYHDGSNSYIKHSTASSDVYFQATRDIYLQPKPAENGIAIKADGAVELYHNNVEMFYTSASGCHVGRPSAAAHLHFLDGGICRFGASNDLEIYHDGSHSYIKDAGTGQLRLQTSLLSVENAGGTENILSGTADAEVNLFYDAVKKFETKSDGIKVTGLSVDIHADSAAPAIFSGDSNRTGSGQHLAEYRGDWNGTNVARIVFATGDDTTNKDDGHFEVHTTPSGGNSTRRMRITSAGNVGITTASPTTNLNVQGGFHISGTATQTHAQDGLMLQRNTSTGNCQIIAGRAGGNYTGLETYVAGASGITKRYSNSYDGVHEWFREDGATGVLKCETNGDVKVNDGNLKIATSGHGIDFSAQTQSSATTNHEVLDHYEEGTFTPSWKGASNHGTTSYGSYNLACYTKIGNIVHVQGFTQITGNSGGSGNWLMTNLPFAAHNSLADSVGSVMIYNFDLPAGGGWCNVYASTNTTNLYIYNSEDNGNWQALQVGHDAAFEFIYQITYTTSA